MYNLFWIHREIIYQNVRCENLWTIMKNKILFNFFALTHQPITKPSYTFFRQLDFSWICYRNLNVCATATCKIFWSCWIFMDIRVHTFFIGNSVGLAFSLLFWPKIKQLLSNCPASDWTFSFKTADFH